MEINLDSFNTEGLLKEVIHQATGQLPGGAGKIINYVIDQIFFPKKEIDPAEALWEKMEKRVTKMVQVKVDDAVAQVLGDMAARSMTRRLRNFGSLFRQLVYINNIDEKKMHLVSLTNEANNILSEMGNIPPMYLLQAAKMLQVLASAHIATLMELKALEPGSYKHQASLNNMSILYSDTAAGMFDASMGWRRAMIGEGKGVIDYSESKVKKTNPLSPDKKIVTMTVWDKYANHHWQMGKGDIVVRKQTPEILKEGGQAEWHDTQMAVYKALTEYDDKVQQEWTEIWNKNLLNVTQSFMQLVDWPGREREQKGEIKREPNQLIFPVVPSRSTHHSAGSLERLDLFLEQQMDQFSISGPRYVQTYRPPAPGFPADHHMVYYRADSYDTAMACIYFLVRGDLNRAQDLGDGLVQAMNHDPLGEGRIVAASYANKLLDPAMNYTTSIYIPDGGRRDIGNMSWTGIALTRLYHQTGVHRYLNAAETIGQWILTNCSKNDPWKGFTGGEDHWRNKQEWRSVEHNVDCVSFFDNLFVLTGKPVWEQAREDARTLVKACYINDQYYVTGTGLGQDLNAGVVPTDCQSWVSLARIDPETDKRSLTFMRDVMSTDSKGFLGTKFAAAGSEIQNEATAGAAMALWYARDRYSEFEKSALDYLESLERQINEAPNAIGYGVVATPAEVADTGEGLGWKYFNYLHVASTAWTGLALLAKERNDANPYASLH